MFFEYKGLKVEVADGSSDKEIAEVKADIDFTLEAMKRPPLPPEQQAAWKRKVLSAGPPIIEPQSKPEK
jgi:hypothetical protein